MVKAKKHAKLDEEEELIPPIKLSSDDDEEANEDLSLKIVRKAMLRACGQKSQSEEAERVTEVKKKKVKKVRRKSKRIKTQNDCVTEGKEALVEDKEELVEDKDTLVAENEAMVIENESMVVEKETMVAEKEALVVEKEAGKAEECKSVETDTLVEPEDKKDDNAVLRKLLRGPRYFDPPDSSWGTCYNCGEEGHTAFKCKSAKRIKPCFVCGSLEHNVKQCTKGKDCYICKKGGHRAKDCREKKMAGVPQSTNLCLKCGEFGHEMFTCRNDYSSDDLKEIQCYVCKSFGHLCCVNYGGSTAGQVSCYRCGQAGHTGLACTRLHGQSNGTSTPSSCYRCGKGGHFARECTSSQASTRLRSESYGTGTPSSCYKCGEGGHFARDCTSSQASTRLRSESYGTGTPSSCYKCGEGGHFARECTSSAKNSKRNLEFSTAKVKSLGQHDDRFKSKSLPFDLDMAPVNGGFSGSSKGKRKNDWISENSGDYTRIKEKHYKNSPLRPTNKIKKFSNSSPGNGYSTTPDSLGSARHCRFDYPPPTDTVGGGYASTPQAYGSAQNHRFDYQHLHPVSDYSVSRDARFYEQISSTSKRGNSTTGKMRNYYN